MTNSTRKSYNPFDMVTHGQRKESPHRAHRVTVYYNKGAGVFYMLSGNAKRANPTSRFTMSCSIQRALRLGMTWDPEDEREIRQSARERAALTNATYVLDENGSRRLIISRPTRRAVARSRRTEVRDVG